jgi:hypothetical protein
MTDAPRSDATPTGPLLAPDLRLNPDAPHPPFPWVIGIPSDWIMLDTHPGTWDRNAVRLVDERFAGRRLPAQERRQVLGFLEQLVADCQRAGASLSLVQLGRMSTGEVGSAGLHLGWFNSAPEPASLAVVRQSLPGTGLVTPVETPAGPALLHRDEASVVPPGGLARVRSTVLQLYLALAGTTWTALLSTATPHPQMQPVLDDLVVAMARSLRPLDERTPVGEGDGVPDYRPAPKPTGPGIEKGFGTLLPHRGEGTDA